ncbi:MAG TPA: UDP-N-acetylmuramoyl-L-alanyl-D-glutamate--2,6-diaminopimelate ligase [Casimicrobiaceae bacterium]|nr:UDP-N-acetylmuramoyl-L-alanyl-D-glutamate--2,6-diaminopimelate ligase [Casimicrobiaceae bacterium]
MRILSREEADALVASLPPLAGITADSREATRDVAFAAYPGTARDGRAFIADALARNAAAVVYEARDFTWDDAWRAPHVGVRDLKSSIGPIASSVYGHPSQALWMVGVTGTNGKTSCAWWIAHALSDCGRRTALAGTLGSGFVDALEASGNTTPDACVLQRSLAQWRRAGAEAVAMEVSSHGLEQRRVDGVAFDVALFTNLTRDHLDYHATMDAYGAAKARLFAWPGLGTAVINEADAFGRELVRRTRARGTRVVTYGADDSDIVATRVDMTGAAMALQLRTPHGAGALAVPLAGAFNVQNVCGVLGVLLASDIALAEALRALSRITPPPGRMQRFGGVGLPLVVVDYAHTPDALEQVLAAMRPAVAAQGVLVCVFGAGGDRDRGKRAPMGEVAARSADRIVVTSDNPRGEDPRAIADAIGEGIARVRDDWIVELDRARAIARAVSIAREGDVIVVAGKGHEDYQESNGVRRAFSDAACVADVLARRRAQ